jgi:hypothetical protein
MGILLLATSAIIYTIISLFKGHLKDIWSDNIWLSFRYCFFHLKVFYLIKW